ncbi:hypothetical protein [Luteimonas sp. FCS-9]|uniref:hypothetical protein n=1 Tax=Luteimonas sp. FCS-9 TaxID=1547516 RepID=UPI00063EC8F5|nr:hypothetical protein [Luteimonas sp. FCS-9]KLJ02847.1 hypothetical protein WQ56_00775 [Luteimonas sp. FCS-9]
MGRIRFSNAVKKKLKEKHDVDTAEAEQCFANRTGKLLEDNREQHLTDPRTVWFIAPTNKGRLLKVCYVPNNGDFDVRTCFPPNEVEMTIYRKHGTPIDF